MDLPALLHQYGYALIFVGALVEGETLLMLGGYFAHRGYLDLARVIATAFVGAVCGDQFFFYIGRHHAKGLLGAVSETCATRSTCRCTGWRRTRSRS